jgi:hypothetical protein
MIEEMLGDGSSRPDTAYLLRRSQGILQQARMALKESKGPGVPVTPKKAKPPPLAAESPTSSQSSSTASTKSRPNSQNHGTNDSPLGGGGSRPYSEHMIPYRHASESPGQSNFQRNSAGPVNSLGFQPQESEYPRSDIPGTIPGLGFHPIVDQRPYSHDVPSSYVSHQATQSDHIGHTGGNQGSYGRTRLHDMRPTSAGQTFPAYSNLPQDIISQQNGDLQYLSRQTTIPFTGPIASREATHYGAEGPLPMAGHSLDNFIHDPITKVPSNPQRYSPTFCSRV